MRLEVAVIVSPAGTIVHVAVDVRATAIGGVIHSALVGGVVEVG